MKFLGLVFGETALSDIAAEMIEDYLPSGFDRAAESIPSKGLSCGVPLNRRPCINSSEFFRTCSA